MTDLFGMVDEEDRLWTRVTWEDGLAVCSGICTSLWFHKTMGKFELRYNWRAPVGIVVMDKRTSNWVNMPHNWEIA